MSVGNPIGRALSIAFPRERTVPGPFDSATAAGLWTVAVWAHSMGLIGVVIAAIAAEFGTPSVYGVGFYAVISLALALGVGTWVQRRKEAPFVVPFVELILIVTLGVTDPPMRPMMALTLLPMAVVSCIFYQGLRTVFMIAAFCAADFALALAAGTSNPLLHSLVATGVCAVIVIPLSVAVRHLTDAGERLVTVFDSLDGIFWQESATDSVMDVSHRAEDVLGYPTHDWSVPGFWRSHIHPDDVDRLNEEIEERLGGAGATSFLYRMRHANGSYRWIENRVMSIRGSDGRHAHYRGVMFDRTDAALVAQNERRVAEVVSTSSLGHCVVSPDRRGDLSTMRVILANDALFEMMPNADRKLVGELLSDLDGSLPRLDDLRRLVIHVAEQNESIELEATSADGRRYSVRAQPISDGSVSISLENVTERHDAVQRIERMVTTDALTGLPNRVAAHRELEQLLANRSADRPLVMAVLDLNQFKEVNDALGHHIGDDLLIEVGRRLADQRERGFVARLGGDEFAVLAEVDRRETGHLLADQLVEALEAPFRLGDLTVQTNASIGLSFWPWDGADGDELMRRADTAMYLGKRQGGGWVEYDSQQDSSGLRRLRLIGELRDAVADDQFELWYQPILELPSRTIVNVEALIRWRHPEFGLVMPDEFVPLAEVSGSIKAMTRWVVERAMADADLLAAAGHAVGVSVNLSARNLYESDLVDWFEETIERRGMPVNGVVLELTETDVMEDSVAALGILTRLAVLGFENCIDDFGTGYTSLGQLRHLPMSTLKVDRSFVAGITTRPADATIVRSVIDLGHNLGLQVVAEGVEDLPTLELLEQYGCDLAQGYYFARPMPYEYLVDLIAGRTSDTHPAPNR